jgi:hypothetical protein
MSAARRTRYNLWCLFLSSQQKTITMRNIYRFLYVLPLLVTALFITGCASDEETLPPTGQTVQPSPPIVIAAPSAGNAVGATETPNTTPVTNIHGSNPADISVILDDFQFAILARPTEIITSKLVAPIMDALLSDAPDNQNPLSQLQTQTGIAVTQIDRVLVLGSVQIPEPTNNPAIYDPQATEREAIDAAPADENQPARDDSEPASDDYEPTPVPDKIAAKKPPTVKYGAVITLLDGVDIDTLVAKLKAGGFKATTVAGVELWQQSLIEQFAVHIKDSSTIMVGSKPELLQMVAGKGGNNALAEIVSSLSGDNLLAVAADTKSVFGSDLDGGAFNELLAETPQIAPVIAFMKKVDSSAIAINPDSDTPIFIELLTPDEKTTNDVFTQINFFASLGKSILPNQVRQFETNPNAKPEMIEALVMANTLVQNISVTKKNKTITVFLKTDAVIRAQIIKFMKMAIDNANAGDALQLPSGVPQ